ncbi:MAG: 4-alpha-glucanotransferase [Heliobacteriaceae bacterium]|nr:4-alpha-glucanotransferase [Heliobacteriaceae bacterium]MDD4587765.1 4-alpha-glucanotransferase [Heliobacteriaceae bacterium]
MERVSGILLHPTSLPGSYGIGDLGPAAYRFVDFLHRAGQKLWQVLPLGPTGYGNSPYAGLSAFAGNPLLLSPETLCRDGLLATGELADLVETLPGAADTAGDQVDFPAVIRFKAAVLQTAYARFRAQNGPESPAFRRFLADHRDWLEAFSLYMVLKDAHHGREWTGWPREYRTLPATGRQKLSRMYTPEITYHQFCQFIFFRQWRALREYAGQKGVRLIGDLPIYVAWDSADAWDRRELFHLDREGIPVEIGGVPPDYFSPEGQLWGNPTYNWPGQKKSGYRWWVRRFQQLLGMVDLIRVDHFRGFMAYWAVPYGAKTAVQGRWKKGSGARLFTAVTKALGPLPVIAEDLGVITPGVVRLKERFGFPGMKILQFAFDANEPSDFLPFRYERNCVVYTGTHDNDPVLGWFSHCRPADREYALRYLNSDGKDICWDFIRLGLASVADRAVFPLQDVLGLGSEARMNVPGTVAGNWCWRCRSEHLNPVVADRLAGLTVLYGR